MKTREEMIERLVEHRIDCWYECIVIYHVVYITI